MGTGLLADGGDRSGNAGLQNRIWNLRLRVNYYYPPDDGFLAANGKKLLHEVIGRIFKPTSPLKQEAKL
jgi:hypothetical protein